jgi:hypothetical protein
LAPSKSASVTPLGQSLGSISQCFLTIYATPDSLVQSMNPALDEGGLCECRDDASVVSVSPATRANGVIARQDIDELSASVALCD